MTMCVLVLGAGSAPSEPDDTPVWLAERRGTLLVERLVRACAPLNARVIFAVRSHDIRRFHIDSVITRAAPSSIIIPVSGETAGAPCTALFCIPEVDPNDELLILNSNEFLDIDYLAAIQGFRSNKFDAATVTFHSIHPRYSYVSIDEGGLIVEAAEKHPISSHATAGFYWFSQGADFISGTQDMIRKEACIDGRYFISLVFNELVLRYRRMGILEVDSRHYHPLKSRRQVELYESDAHPGGMM